MKETHAKLKIVFIVQMRGLPTHNSRTSAVCSGYLNYLKSGVHSKGGLTSFGRGYDVSPRVNQEVLQC